MPFAYVVSFCVSLPPYLYKVQILISAIIPEVSRFYGIVIKMFFKPKEHEPAHIHALYDTSN